MKLHTKRTRILDVKRAWREQYPDGGNPHQIDIGKKLDKLDLKKVSAAEVDAIIGNASWTALDCDVCGEPVTAAVEFTDRWGDRSMWACRKCVDEMCALFPARRASQLQSRRK